MLLVNRPRVTSATVPNASPRVFVIIKKCRVNWATENESDAELSDQQAPSWAVGRIILRRDIKAGALFCPFGTPPICSIMCCNDSGESPFPSSRTLITENRGASVKMVTFLASASYAFEISSQCGCRLAVNPVSNAGQNPLVRP